VQDPNLPPQNGQRSFLSVFGQAGNLPVDPAWTDITVVTHQNQDIDGNVLAALSINSNLYVGPNNFLLDQPGPATVGVDFVETPNHVVCSSQPAPTAPINPLTDPNDDTVRCDDYALISAFDIAPHFVSAADSGAGQDYTVNFRLFAALNDPNALVCTGAPGQDARCGGYNGCHVALVNGQCPLGESGLVIYTVEHMTNSIAVQANVSQPPVPIVSFVIGDCEFLQAPPGQAKKNPPPPDNNLREIGDIVNFWGSQWWKNNCMSVLIENGYPAFKGYATSVDPTPGHGGVCGQWQARPGNSGHPPATLPNIVNIIVTDTVTKDGPNIGGIIKQIVTVDRSQAPQDNYAGNPGHQGWGKIIDIPCGTNPGP
jgi:hypothetical protein